MINGWLIAAFTLLVISALVALGYVLYLAFGPEK